MTTWLSELLSTPDFWGHFCGIVLVGILDSLRAAYANRLSHGKRKPPESGD